MTIIIVIITIFVIVIIVVVMYTAIVYSLPEDTTINSSHEQSRQTRQVTQFVHDQERYDLIRFGRQSGLHWVTLAIGGVGD